MATKHFWVTTGRSTWPTEGCPLRIVVVIPALNEADALPRTLKALRESWASSTPWDAGVTVADCDSDDATAGVAEAAGASVVRVSREAGRGGALRAGVAAAWARAADAQAVWMLHADTLPPKGWAAAIAETLSEPGVVGGGFTQRFATRGCRWHEKHRLKFVARCNRIRCARSGVFFGDQGIFVRRDALAAIGGVPDLPILEDVRLCQRLRVHGVLRLRPERITTSPRRFLHRGIERQLLDDGRLLWNDRRGHTDAQRLAAYRADNRR